MIKKTLVARTTEKYKARLSPNIRPQDDFFDFANAKWLKDNPIPASESRWGSFNILRDEAWQNLRNAYDELEKNAQLAKGTVEQQVSDFYHTGINYDDLEARHLEFIRSKFEMIDSLKTSNDLAKTIGSIQETSTSVPWGVIVDVDDKDSSSHIIRFGQGGLTLPDRDYYLEDTEKMKKVRHEYNEHIKRVYQRFPDLAPSEQTLLDVIVSFETELAKIARTKSDLREVEANYNKMTYAKLKKTYSTINWKLYAEAIGWEPNDQISVDQPEFLEFINTKFKELPMENWRIYLKWHLLKAHLSQISERYALLKFEFFGKVLSGTEQIMPLWKRVTLFMDDAMGEAIGKIYAKRHFSEEAKHQVLDIVEDIRNAYHERIKDLDWMSDKTKEYALKKLANMKVLIGYPDKWRDFSKLEINRVSYIDNIVAAERFDKQYWFGKLSQPTTRDEWFMYPQTVNAYHDPNRLVICFPAAILQSPFFDQSAPLAANYGGIGAVIGHELTHGFDDQGSQFDADGNVKTWQSESERKEFNKKAKLIIDQADKFEVLPGVHLKGKLVIGESIADLGGVELAYQALHKKLGDSMFEVDASGLTAEQIFFINFATCECGATREERQRDFALTDPHPAEKFRVNAMLAHVDAFYKAFSVKEGDGLYRNPDERAKIW